MAHGKSAPGLFVEELTELLAGAEDAALHRADGHIETLGDLDILISGDVHLERLAIILREILDHLVDLRSGKTAIGRLERRLPGDVEIIEVA